MILPQTADSSTAVRFSGRLDNAVLLGTLRERFCKIQPLFVRCGLAWESSELQAAGRFVDALADPRVEPVVVLEMPPTAL